MNHDISRNSCDADEEVIARPTLEVNSKDPILIHLKRVVNGRTRKTPIVTGFAQVQESSFGNYPGVDVDEEKKPEKLPRLVM